MESKKYATDLSDDEWGYIKSYLPVPTDSARAPQDTRFTSDPRRRLLRPKDRVGGEHRGYDGNKKVRGRKRHLLVDIEGLLLKVKVHSAKVADQDGLRLLL